MNLVLLVGDHALRAPRARDSVATLLAMRAPSDWLVLDRTVAGGSRAVADLAIESLVDLDRLRARAETAHLVVSMNVGDLAGGGTNPHDWLRRWLRIEATATRLGWSPMLVQVEHGEEANRAIRRFERRLAAVVEEAAVDSIRIDATEWPAPTDPGSEGVGQIASAIHRSLAEIEAVEPVVVTRRSAPSSLAG